MDFPVARVIQSVQMSLGLPVILISGYDIVYVSFACLAADLYV